MLLRWILSACAFLLTAYIVPGFKVRNFGSALIASLVLGVLVLLLGKLLFILTLPLTIVTFGIFYFILAGIFIKMCAAFVPGFAVDSWFAAIIGAILLSVFNSLLDQLVIGG